MQITSSGITDVGLKRSHNEDNFLINDQLALFVVADGMGGHNGGEYASAIAVTTVEEIVGSLGRDPGATPPSGQVGDKLAYAVRLAGRRIHERAQEDPRFHGMGTTAVAVQVSDGKAYVAHVGDSRVYLVRGGAIEQVTEDHSFVARQVKAGVLTEEEARTHRMRNVIYRSLGFQEDVDVDLSVHDVQPGDLFLLCSDGLSGYLEADELLALLSEHGLQEACRRMVDIACERGGDDNITAVVARVDAVDG